MLRVGMTQQNIANILQEIGKFQIVLKPGQFAEDDPGEAPMLGPAPVVLVGLG